MASTDDYIKAVTTAGERSRKALFASQILCVIILIVVGNSLPTSWTSERTETAQLAKILYDCASLKQNASPEVKERASPEVMERGSPKGKGNASPGAKGNAPPGVKASASPGNFFTGKPASAEKAYDLVNICWAEIHAANETIEKEDLIRAALWCILYGYDANGIEERMKELEEFTDKNVYSISVPLTSLRVDINDFGILAGIGFFILLGWLSLSLNSEANVTDISLRKLDSDSIRLMAAGQVFSPSFADQPNYKRIKLFLSCLSICSAPAVYIIWFIFDYFTGSKLSYLNKTHLDQLYGIEIAFMVVNTLLASWALKRFFDTYEIWKTNTAPVPPAPTPPASYTPLPPAP